jgi:hypothetical protein
LVRLNEHHDKEHCMINKRLAAVALSGAIAAAAIVPATGSATATKSGTYKVTPTKLNVYEQPTKGYEGVLFEGETFVVKKLSKSGKYAYGKANGHVSKMAWVTASSLSKG